MMHTDATDSGVPKRSRRRSWLFRLIWAIVVPLVVLALLEGALRLAGVGHPTGYFLGVSGQDAYMSNPRFGWRFFPRRLSREPRPIHVPAEKGPDVFRIFVLGGSAAQGIPDPSFSFSRVLEVMLAEAYPDTTFEVYNVGMTAINSHVCVPIARDCASHAPDLYIVYMGNNEVRGPFGVGTGYQSRSPSLKVIRASLAAKSLRIAQLLGRLTDAITGRQKSGPREWGGMEMNLANPVPGNDPRLAKVYDDFRANARDICLAGVDAGADVVLCTVGVNLQDCPPFGSIHRADLNAEDLAAWDQAFQAGLLAERTGHYDRAIDQYRRAEEIDPQFAATQFRLGQCHLALDQLDQAQAALRLARDLDGLRFRTDSRLNEIVRDVAAELDDRGVRLVDVERVFDGAADVPGIPGSGLLYEHVHMTFPGNYAIARALFDVIADSSSFEGTPPVTVLSEKACADRLVLTPWKQRSMATYIVGTMSRPPFVGQFGNDRRIALWTEQVNEAVALQTDAAVEQACQDYAAALARSPDDVEMRYDFGQFLLNDLHRYDQAEQQFRLVLERLPDVSRYSLRLGISLQAQGRSAEAIEAFERAVELSPRPAQISAKIAGIYDRNNMPAEALRWAEQALAMEDDVGEALRIAGAVYARQGRYREAATVLSAYLDQDPRLGPRDLASVHCTLAMCLSLTGQAGEASAIWTGPLRSIRPSRCPLYFAHSPTARPGGTAWRSNSTVRPSLSSRPTRRSAWNWRCCWRPAGILWSAMPIRPSLRPPKPSD